MQATTPKLKAGAPPPPPANTAAARRSTLQRARQAVKLMERHGWVTDGEHYASRWSALGVARRLRDGVIAHEGATAAELTWRVWLEGAGWRWQLGLKRVIAERGQS